MNKKAKLTIGIVGPICVGKETVAEYLQRKYKATFYSLSDVIREELDFLGFDRHSRELLQAIGNELRHHRGSDYLARKVVDKMKMKNQGFTVIGSIRNPEEAVFLSESLSNFHLISVGADQKIRFKRLIKRNRLGDPRSWEEFVKVESREFNQRSHKVFHMKIDVVSEMADFYLDNSKGKKVLYKNIDELINNLLKPSIKNRLREITIAVGSSNPVKIAAVKAASEKIFPHLNIIGVTVDSGVSPTPLSDEESIRGATRRARIALKKVRSDWAVGLEGGLRKVGSDHFVNIWAVIISSNGEIGIGGGSNVQIPKRLVSQLKKEPEFSKIMQKLIRSKGIKSKVGAVGILTKGLVKRRREAEVATSAAFARFLSSELYRERRKK